MMELSNFSLNGEKDITENMTKNLGSLRYRKYKVRNLTQNYYKIYKKINKSI